MYGYPVLENSSESCRFSVRTSMYDFMYDYAFIRLDVNFLRPPES